MLLPNQIRRIINPQPKAENWLLAMSRLIPVQIREALVGDILEDCHELRQEEHGEWWMRAFVFRTCLSEIVMLWASAVLKRLLGMRLNAIVKHPRKNTAFLLAVPLIVMGLVVYTRFAEVANHNSLALDMLAAELLIEAGPDFEFAKREHVEMLRRYVGYREQGRQSLVLRLFPQNTEPLRSVLSGLEQARPGEARQAIQKAGVQLNQLRMNVKRYPTVTIGREKYRSLSPSLSYDIDSALAESDSRFNEFKRHPTKESSARLCMAHRKVTLQLLLVATEHHIPDRIQSFLQDAEGVVHIYATPAIKTTATREGWHDFLLRRTVEEEHRIRLLRAMSKNELNEAQKILIEIIEHAEELNKILKSGKVERAPPFL